MCVILGVMVTVGAVVARIPVLVAIGMVPFAFLYAIGARLSASIDDDGFQYRGWVGTKTVYWRDVVSVVSAPDLPYPMNHYNGPATYVIRTPDKKIVVNMLYFSEEFARAFHIATVDLRRGHR